MSRPTALWLALSLGLAPTSHAQADEEEVRWSARPVAGVARVAEGQADAAFALSQGAAVALAYGLSEELDFGAELVALATEPTFDAAIPIQRVVTQGPFKRRTSAAWVLLGPTWRFGSPADWTPVVAASAGGGLRYRSVGFFSELGLMPEGKEAALAVDLATSAKAGFERRINRRWTFGAYVSLLAAWSPDAELLSATTISLGLSYAYYPRWRNDN